jgi:hypothetical protein
MNIASLQWTNLLEEALPREESKVTCTSADGVTRVKLDMRCFEIRTLQITLDVEGIWGVVTPVKLTVHTGCFDVLVMMQIRLSRQGDVSRHE